MTSIMSEAWKAQQAMRERMSIDPKDRPQDPMGIWNLFKATDPLYTKQANNGRFDFTCIDPQYQLMQATQLWGPYGKNWGLRNLKYSTFASDNGTTMMLEAEFFYEAQDGTEVVFPIAVDAKFRTGDDCCKKLLTNARSKALSFLGFAADVFLGKFDDAAYVNDAKLKFGDQEAFVKKAMASIKQATTKEALDKCQERINTLIVEETVPESVWRELVAAINERRQSI